MRTDLAWHRYGKAEINDVDLLTMVIGRKTEICWLYVPVHYSSCMKHPDGLQHPRCQLHVRKQSAYCLGVHNSHACNVQFFISERFVLYCCHISHSVQPWGNRFINMLHALEQWKLCYIHAARSIRLGWLPLISYQALRYCNIGLQWLYNFCTLLYSYMYAIKIWPREIGSLVKISDVHCEDFQSKSSAEYLPCRMLTMSKAFSCL